MKINYDTIKTAKTKLLVEKHKQCEQYLKNDKFPIKMKKGNLTKPLCLKMMKLLETEIANRNDECKQSFTNNTIDKPQENTKFINNNNNNNKKENYNMTITKNELATLINTAVEAAISNLKKDMIADYNMTNERISKLETAPKAKVVNKVSKAQVVDMTKIAKLRKQNSNMLKQLDDTQRMEMEKAYNPIWAKIDRSIDKNNKELRSAKFITARNKLMKSMFSF